MNSSEILVLAFGYEGLTVRSERSDAAKAIKMRKAANQQAAVIAATIEIFRRHLTTYFCVSYGTS